MTRSCPAPAIGMLLLACVVTLARSAPVSDEIARERSSSLLAALRAGRWEQAEEHFDDAMKAAMPAAALRRVRRFT